MHILVINASSYGRRGITASMLNPFLDGVRDAGGTSEVVVLNRLNIHPCRGDLSCWFKKKNVCIQNDDMTALGAKFNEADCIVFSTPVFCDGVPGPLKVMMDRLVVKGSPFLELRDGHSRHPASPDHRPDRFVLIASCGLWEMDNFIPMTTHLQAFCRNVGYRWSGALLRPHSFAMRSEQVNDIFRAARAAGRELVVSGAITTASTDAVGREIVPRETYIGMINKKAEVYVHLE
jgi:putative NADPH-quinone reductase